MRGFDAGVELLSRTSGPQDKVDELTKRIKLIDSLCAELRKPTTWNFTSDLPNPWRRLIKVETTQFGDLIALLEAAREQLEATLAELQRALAREPK